MECDQLRLLNVSHDGFLKHINTPCLGPSTQYVWSTFVPGSWHIYGWPGHPRLQKKLLKVLQCKEYARVTIFIQDYYKSNRTTWFLVINSIWKKWTEFGITSIEPVEQAKPSTYILGFFPNYWDTTKARPSVWGEFPMPPRPWTFFALGTKPFQVGVNMTLFDKVPEKFWPMYLNSNQILNHKAQIAYLERRANILRDCYKKNYSPEPPKIIMPSVKTPKGLADWPGKPWSEIDLPIPQTPIKEEDLEPGSYKNYLTITLSSNDLANKLFLKIKG